nr:hypothetical protein [uncultured Campylobacter sp.]
MQTSFMRHLNTAKALGMASGILVILNLLSQEMVLPKSLFDIATSMRVAMLFVSVICLYGAISKVNKLAGGGVFKLYRIFIAVSSAMILLSFSANYAPASTHKILFFVICGTAVLAFLLWIRINFKLGAVTQNALFSGYAVLCIVGTLIASALKFLLTKALRDPYPIELAVLGIYLALGFIYVLAWSRVDHVENYNRD